MPEKYSIDQIPSTERLAAARRDNRYNVEIDELDKTTLDRIKKFCSRNNLFSSVEDDPASGQYKISIYNANLPVIEQIEGVLHSSTTSNNGISETSSNNGISETSKI